MFKHNSQFSLTPAYVVATLAMSVLAVCAALVDAVAGMESFL